MAQIVGGIASSHTPTIAYAFDNIERQDPVWGPIFDGFAPVMQWIKDKAPDVLLFIYNDHITSFFFDHYSHFALGVGREYPVADEGGGRRDLPPLKGDPEFARHLATGLTADEFDLSFFQGKALDHGVFSPLSLLLPHDPDWTAKVVPFQVGVLQFPIPSAKRCFEIGKALRRAILSYPKDLKVAVVATGGLAHQVHGERAGFNNTEWDKEFLELLEKDPEKLTEITIAEYAKRGGLEGTEVIMWLVMRGALSKKVTKVHEAYFLPSMTPIANVIFEEVPDGEPAETTEKYLRRIHREFDGLEQIEGTYPFTLERSVKAYRLNEFLHSLIDSKTRLRFRADPEILFEEALLSGEERDMIRRRDWRAMIRYGVIFFLLEKLAAVVGMSNMHVYAAMRGESLEEFQKTRNVHLLYSVSAEKPAKQDAESLWDQDLS
jgi:gallate dioxygenase